jgi:hypothetical protein
VAASEQPAGRANLRVRGREDLREHLDRQVLGEGRDREGEQRRAAHGEDVVERVRRRDRTVVVGLVDDRGEEVEREDDRALVVDAVDRRVVRGREADEQVLGLQGDEALQQRLEPSSRVLRRTAAAGGQVGELDPSGLRSQREPSSLVESRNSRDRESSRA